jgi:hypothetical protein
VAFMRVLLHRLLGKHGRITRGLQIVTFDSVLHKAILIEMESFKRWSQPYKIIDGEIVSSETVPYSKEVAVRPSLEKKKNVG